MRLRVMQFNTLGKHLAEVVQFPYAVDVSVEQRVAARAPRFVDWDSYGAAPWLRAALDATGLSPREYLLEQDERGTFSIEEAADGRLIYNWAERLEQLVRQVTAHPAEIVCLQEVESATVAEFSLALGARVVTLTASGGTESKAINCDAGAPHIFDAVYAPRTEAPTSDGAMLLWRVAALQACGAAELLRYSDGQKLAVLQPLVAAGGGPASSAPPLVVCTTHLHWNPAAPLQGREISELIEVRARAATCRCVPPRKRSSRCCGAAAYAHTRARDQHASPLWQALSGRGAVLLAADLNCGRQNACFQQLLAAGFEDVDTHVHPSQRKRFTMHVPRAPLPKLTDARRWEDRAVTELHPVESDYVMTRGLRVTAAAALEYGTSTFEPARDNGLPHKAWSASDHFPVGYELSLELGAA